MTATPTPTPRTQIDFHLLLREAEEIICEKPVYRRYIDGTPLQNDVPVWMAVFAQSHARDLERENAALRARLSRLVTAYSTSHSLEVRAAWWADARALLDGKREA